MACFEHVSGGATASRAGHMSDHMSSSRKCRQPTLMHAPPSSTPRYHACVDGSPKSFCLMLFVLNVWGSNQARYPRQSRPFLTCTVCHVLGQLGWSNLACVSICIGGAYASLIARWKAAGSRCWVGLVEMWVYQADVAQIYFFLNIYMLNRYIWKNLN